jgi:hypothetical protein
MMRMTWLHKTRLRVLAFALGITLAALGVLSLWAVPVWSVVGFAVAATAVAVNSMTSRLVEPTCLGCGESLGQQTPGDYGVICPHCGLVNQSTPTTLADAADDDSIDA